jgi:hypothetical protein
MKKSMYTYMYIPSKTWKTFAEPAKHVEDVVEDVRIPH